MTLDVESNLVSQANDHLRFDREEGIRTIHDSEELSDRQEPVEHDASPEVADGKQERRSCDDHFKFERVIEPQSQLPKPEPPPGVLLYTPAGHQDEVDAVSSAIKAFFNEKRTNLSASIGKRLSFLAVNRDESGDFDGATKAALVASLNHPDVTQFDISGLKVIVMSKNAEESFKGRISFFSRSNCRDCTAVRSFFRGKGLRFVEINLDVFPQREKELVQRAGKSEVPSIFLNGKHLGGLVALNSLRNSGDFDSRVREILNGSSTDDAPSPPSYGFDDPDETEQQEDAMVMAARILRQRLPIQDRLLKMKIIQNCFSGDDMVEVLVRQMGYDRTKASDVGKELVKKHFIHHVFGKRDFYDGNHFYRFLEHEPFVPKCYNFRGSTNDGEPKNATLVASGLYKIMTAILEAYSSVDRCHVDYVGVSKSEEFRRYLNLVQDLQRVDLLHLLPGEKLAFFLNLYNAMVIHAVIRNGYSKGVMDRRSFYSDFQYIVGGSAYSLNAIKNGILRSNRRSPYSLVKPFGAGDRRLELAFTGLNPLIHFGLCNGTRSSPSVRFFTPQGVEAELRQATREFFQRGGVEVNLEMRCLHVSRIMNWFSGDFGQEKQMMKWVMTFLDASKAGLLTHLMSDGGGVNILYQDYDWSLNSYTVSPFNFMF